MLKRRRRPGGVELGRRLKDLPPAQSGSITFVLAASGLVSVGLEIVAVTTYARAVSRACRVRRLGIPAAVREACTRRFITLSGVHLLYKFYLRFALVRWVERAGPRVEHRNASSQAPSAQQ